MPRITVPARRRKSLERSHMAQDHLQHRTFVRRQLQDERRRFALSSVFLNSHAIESAHDPEQIHAQQRQSRKADEPEDSGSAGCTRRSARCTRANVPSSSSGGDENGDQTILGRFDGAGGHDSRDGAGERRAWG